MSIENSKDICMKKEEDSDSEPGYAILTDDFIKTAFESLDGYPGVSGISQEAVDALNQDVCYRVREVTHMAAQMMRHGGRRRLTHGHMTRALRWYGAPTVLGHSTERPLALLPLADSGLWVAEQRDCDLAQLALSADPPPPPPLPPDSQLSAYWLAMDGRQSDVKPDPDRPPGSLSVVEQDYYEQMTRALFGANLELLQMALHDLETSVQLAPVLPHLLRCLLQAIRHLAAQPGWMHRLLRALQALTRNATVNLGCKPNLNHIASALVFCAIEGQQKTADPLVDPVCVKDFSARLLSQLVHKWTTPVNQLPEQIARTLHDVVQDRRRILRQQYGAITALTYMGPEAIMRYLCPLLPQYVPAMLEVLSTPQLDLPTRLDAMRVQAALALAIQHYLRYAALELAASVESAGLPGPPPMVIYQLWAELCDGVAAAPPPPAACLAALAAHRPPPPPPASRRRGCSLLWPPGSRRPSGVWLQLVRVPPGRRRPLPPRAAVFQGTPLRQRFPTIYFSFIGASPLPEHLLRRVQFPRSHPIASQAPLDARPRRGGLRRWPAGGGHVQRSGHLSALL